MDPFIKLMIGISTYTFLAVSAVYISKTEVSKKTSITMWKFFEENPLLPTNLIFFNTVFWVTGVNPIAQSMPGSLGAIVILVSILLSSPLGTLPLFLHIDRIFRKGQLPNENHSLEA